MFFVCSLEKNNIAIDFWIELFFSTPQFVTKKKQLYQLKKLCRNWQNWNKAAALKIDITVKMSIDQFENQIEFRPSPSLHLELDKSANQRGRNQHSETITQLSQGDFCLPHGALTSEDAPTKVTKPTSMPFNFLRENKGSLLAA